MLARMVAAGRKVLSDHSLDADDAQFCFHKPPYNSIDHLHLHVIATASEMHSHMVRMLSLLLLRARRCNMRCICFFGWLVVSVPEQRDKYTRGSWFYVSVEVRLGRHTM